MPPARGSLVSQLVLLRRVRGGTALVVVTGLLAPDALPMVAALRAVASTGSSSYPWFAMPSGFPYTRVSTIVEAATADELVQRWNTGVAR